MEIIKENGYECKKYKETIIIISVKAKEIICLDMSEVPFKNFREKIELGPKVIDMCHEKGFPEDIIVCTTEHIDNEMHINYGSRGQFAFVAKDVCVDGKWELQIMAERVLEKDWPMPDKILADDKDDREEIFVNNYYPDPEK